MRKVCDITFTFADLATAEFDSDSPCVSPVLDKLLRQAPSFVRCPHHGIYNYECSLGASNTIRIQQSGLFVIMHDGDCFDSHPLFTYLQSELTAIFPHALFNLS